MIKFITSDKEIFEVSEAAASLSQTISNMIEDECAEGVIPNPNVAGFVLAKVLQYCNKHAGDGSSSSSVSSEPEGTSSSSWPGQQEEETDESFGKVLIDVGQDSSFAWPAAASSDAAAADEEGTAAASLNNELIEASVAAHVDEEEEEDDLESFDANFFDVDQDMLYDLLMAANFLEIKGLLDIAAKKVADMIRDKTPEEIRPTFGIENDFVTDQYGYDYEEEVPNDFFVPEYDSEEEHDPNCFLPEYEEELRC